jgi:hypothetical protein
VPKTAPKPVPAPTTAPEPPVAETPPPQPPPSAGVPVLDPLWYLLPIGQWWQIGSGH